MNPLYCCTLFMLALAVVGCQQEAAPVATAPDATETTQQQQADVSSTEPSDAPETASKEFIIDVRSQEEWDSGHLRDAVWIPHTEIAERIEEVTEDKSAKLVLY